MARSIQLPAFPCRDHAERHGDHNGEDEGDRHQREASARSAVQSGPKPARLVKIDVPRSPCRISPQPGPELHQKRLVETEGSGESAQRRRARLIARDHRRRISRRDVKQAEDEKRDDRHHGHGRENTPEDVGNHLGSPLCRHAVFVTSQKKGSGPFHNARDVLAPGRVAEEEAGRRVNNVLHRGLLRRATAAFSSSRFLASNHAVTSFSTASLVGSPTTTCRHCRECRHSRRG